MNNNDTAVGLSAAEAALRLAADGRNALPDRQHRTLFRFVWEAAHEPMFLLLFVAGLLYLTLGELQEGLFLFAMVLLTLGMTLYQEGKTERALEALRDMSSPHALVIRDGQRQRIDSRDLVRGDLIVLAEGDRVPADGTLISQHDMRVDESLLTGESVAVSKLADADAAVPAHPGGDGLPFIYSGTMIVSGYGIAGVTATGPLSEIGRIGSALEALPTESSLLQKQTARLVTTLALLGLALSLLLVIVYGLLRGNWLQALLAGIALAMSMLPEEFPVVLTIFPALGAWRLARAQVLTRRLAAIETLGATSVLCVDKTGTLTENKMSVARMYAQGKEIAASNATAANLPEAFHTLIEFSILASALTPTDPMEKAFHLLGEQILAGTDRLHRNWTLEHEYALTQQLRAMSHAWKAAGENGHVVAAKGSPEAIVDLCHLDATTQQAVLSAADNMAQQGLRVLGVAQARFTGDSWPATEHDFDFVFAGLMGLADPLRQEIPDAVHQCRQAGIRVVMITGDYPATANAIAAQAGIAPGALLTGDAIATMSEAQLRAHMQTANVCARVAPSQKLRIVQALKASGDIVAMTGDGVNDAPALKAAHVGIAMGKRGTEVARESAALVLLDDNFTSIVDAIRHGRRIFTNMQKSMTYILSIHLPIAGMALLPVLLGWPVMLYPMHIVFLELVIDPACSIAFENEPPEIDVMTQSPRDPNAALFGGWTLALAILQGVGALLAVAASYAWAKDALPEPQARAFGFATLIIANLALIFANRSRSRTIVESLRSPNSVLWAVTGATLALLVLALYQPFLANIFRFAPLSIAELASACGIGFSSVLWFELMKVLLRRSRKQ